MSLFKNAIIVIDYCNICVGYHILHKNCLSEMYAPFVDKNKCGNLDKDLDFESASCEQCNLQFLNLPDNIKLLVMLHDRN